MTGRTGPRSSFRAGPDVIDVEAGLRLRLRVPSQRGGDPGTVTIEVQLGEPPQPINGCQIIELVFGTGSSSDSGVVTSADAGSATLRLVDPLRLFDPANASSTFTGIGTTVRILLNGTTAFRGRVDDVQHDLDVATLQLVDGIALLAGIQFVETSVPAEAASARITRILDLAGWPADRRDIGAGGRSLQAGTVSSDAWSELLEVTRNELGALWLTADGRVAWRNRTAAWTGGAPVMTFGCAPSDSFIGSLTTRADQSDLVNVIAAARRGGTQAIRQDTTSLAQYGRHSHVQNDLELATDDERDLWADFYIIRQANPATGVAGFDMRPDAAAIAKLLALQLGAIVRVYDEHHGPVIDAQLRWLGSKWRVTSSYVEVAAVVGEDASIRQVTRHAVIDTPTQWQTAGAAVPNTGRGFDGSGLFNGSFESDLASWYISAGTVTTPADTAIAVNGSKYARITGPGNVPYIGQSSTMPVVPGVTYRLTAYARSLGGSSTGQVSCHTYTPAGAIIAYHVFVCSWVAGSSGWREAYWQCPKDGSVGYVQAAAFINNGAAVAGDVWAFDDIRLVAGNLDYREPGVAPHSLPAAY